MTSPDTSSADTGHLRLVRESSTDEVHYHWSPGDQSLCQQIFTAAGKAGVQISGDCVRAVSRSHDPGNEVQLDKVLLAELGNDDFLHHPKQRGIAAFAAGLLQSSTSPALSIAGDQLTARVQLAESGVMATKGSGAEDLSGQDENWERVH